MPRLIVAGVTTPADLPPTQDPGRPPLLDGPRIYSWMSGDGARIEQARVVARGERLRVRGHLIEAETEERPAFTLTYDVEVDAADEIRRVGLESVTVSGEKSINLRRDGEGAWLLESAAGATDRVGEEGVRSVLIDASMLFFSLAVRGNALQSQQDEVSEPALSVDPYDLSVSNTSMEFRSDDSMIHGITGDSATSAHVDSDGFVADVPGSFRRR